MSWLSNAPFEDSMAKNDHDRNMLFGIHALQMDFINREALVITGRSQRASQEIKLKRLGVLYDV